MDRSRNGAAWGVAAVVCVLVAVAAVPVLLAGAVLTPLTSQTAGSAVVCVTRGPIAGLSPVAAQNARLVAATASARGGDTAAVIALMVGITESGLRVLGNPNDPSANGLAAQGIGDDHDSIGIFQQRPSWGTPTQRLDPEASTNLFLDRVLAIPDWASDAPWVVAQEVQVSAWDGVPRAGNGFDAEVGGNYQAQLGEAAQLLATIDRDAAGQGCGDLGGSGVGRPPPGPTNAFGLPVSYTVPDSASAAGRTVVLAALSVLGRPYVFGAAGPDAFDCSGLAMWAWAHAGVTLPHYTVEQWHAGVATDPMHLAPGDLVLTPGSDGTMSDPQHVGMFLGDDLVVEAPDTGDVVRVVSYASFVSDGLAGLRHIA